MKSQFSYSYLCTTVLHFKIKEGKMFILKYWTTFIKQYTADMNSPAEMQTHDLEKLFESQSCTCWNDSSEYKVTTPQVIKWQ